jgi:hypothetical protein
MKIELQRRIGEALLPLFFATAPSHASADSARVRPESASVEETRGVTYGSNKQADFTGSLSVALPVQAKRLTFAEEKEFHQLAIKFALGTITDEESKEMRRLDARRLVDEKPLSQASIIRRERVLTKIDDLVRELNSFRRV